MKPLESLLQDNFIVIDNFIDEQSAKSLYRHLKAEAKDHPELFKSDSQCPESISIYNFRWFLELLINKIPFVEEVMEEPIFPTYSYSRIYKNGTDLKPHVDKPICEISISMHLDSDGTRWPIYFTRPDGVVVELELQPGQAVMYLGCISKHWREKFEGQEYGQVFLHYVRGRGPNWDYYFDKKYDEKQIKKGLIYGD